MYYNRGFSWKFWKKWREKTVFLSEWTFFLQNMGMRTVFIREWIFLIKYGHERSSFSVKIRKKIGTLLTFLAYNISAVLTELTFFWPNMGMTGRDFSWKIKKWHGSVFLRKWTFFWQNMGMKAACFLEIWRSFDKIWAWEQRFFRSKSEKKRFLYTFLAHNIL